MSQSVGRESAPRAETQGSRKNQCVDTQGKGFRFESQAVHLSISDTLGSDLPSLSLSKT